jgi:GT2 family glycosyltransferase
MTWAWSIPGQPPPGHLLRLPFLEPTRTRVVVPTYRDWPGVRLTIESLRACDPAPAEIVLVDDNDGGTPPPWTRDKDLILLEYPGNRGPAYARNAGANLETSRTIDWLVFTDGGCTRRADYFAALAAFSRMQPLNTVAIAAPVRGVVRSPHASPINHYMTEEAILCPPRDAHGPQAIVTANAAVAALAFAAIGGFDASYPFAAGEDLDLGLRLRRMGSIAWFEGAVVWHEFEESLLDFRRRFERYGRGNAHLAMLHGLPSLRPTVFQPLDPALQWLADEQVAAMRRGYDEQLRLLAGTTAQPIPA